MGLRRLGRAIRQAGLVLQNPEREFRRIPARTFEAIVVDYVLLLLASSAAAFVVSLAYSVLRAAYLDLFKVVDIHYWRMLNFATGTAVSLFFFTVFAGTFLVFFLSLLIRPFGRGLKYTRQLSVLLYALSPLLLFSWIPAFHAGLFLWGGVLLAVGLRLAPAARVALNTIQERE